MPELQGDEQLYIAALMKDMSEEQAEQFARVYRTRRKDPTLTLMLALLGFIVVAGVHRFNLGQVGMGLLYLFTGGLCVVGTVVDLFNHRNLTWEHNRKQADEVALLVRNVFPRPPEALPPGPSPEPTAEP